MKEPNKLRVKNLGIDTYKENIYMHSGCHISRSEGYTALTRKVSDNSHFILATGLSIKTIRRLGINEGHIITIHHLQPVESIAVRKMHGKRFNEDQLFAHYERYYVQ